MISRKLSAAVLGAGLFAVACSSPFSIGNKKEAVAPLNDRMLAFQERITPEFLRAHLTIYASDEFAGRETGLRGQKLAVEYLVAQLRSLNIKPAGENGGYLQDVALKAMQKDSSVYTFHHDVDGETVVLDRSVSSLNTLAHVVTGWGGTDSGEAEIVYAGFAVDDSSSGVMHLGDIDIKDKYVLAFEEIAHVVDGDTLIDPKNNWRQRFGNVITQKGAKGLLLINTEGFEELQENATSAYTKYSGLSLAYLNRETRVNSQSYNRVHPTVAAKLLGVENIKEAHDALMADVKGFSPRALNVSMSMDVFASNIDVDSENVVGIVEGTDPILKDEYVVLTAHLDHVGIGAPDETGDTIYNGADDDGSGTIGMLNVAKALQEAAEAGHSPRRSVVFLWVTAEEKGLLGSQYYADHPIYPMDKTIANINIDMIGRVDKEHEAVNEENYSYIIGAEIISSDIDATLKAANALSGNIDLDMKFNDLEDPNQFYRRSDHWNFGKFGIPFIFFFTGVHDDYHRPGDEVDKIGFDKMTRITRTVYGTTVMLANDDKRPLVDNQAFIEKTKSLAR
jgi:hypothetical protein